MSLTDKQIDDIKEYCANVGATVTRLTVLEILDRLDAAERCCEAVKEVIIKTHNCYPERISRDTIRKILYEPNKAWRLEAGKPQGEGDR